MARSIIVTGASSGLGKKIIDAVFNFHDRINWSFPYVDVSSEISVKLNASTAPEKLDVLVNCAGVNHIEWIPKMKEIDWDRVMDTNVKSMWLTAKHLCENLRGGTILNIVSNASHIPMTTSAAYNASKGAAAILTKQLHRELFKTHGITVFSVSPNKLSGTKMSEYIDKRVCELRGWTKEQAIAYQAQALPVGEETDPAVLAEFIAFLLSTKERHQYLGGCDIPYGA